MDFSDFADVSNVVGFAQLNDFANWPLRKENCEIEMQP